MKNIFLLILLTCQTTFAATKYLQGNVVKSLDLSQTWSMPASSDTVMGRQSVDTMTNKTFNAAGTGNVLSNVANSHIATGAAIAYSKLNLTGSVTSSDITAAAGIPYSKLTLTGSVVNADVGASAAIAYSKLNLANSLVSSDLTTGSVTTAKILDGTIVSGDISGTAGILYSQTLLTNSIVSGDLTTGAVTTAKILDATITSADVSASAGLNAASIGDGTVSTAEFQYLGTATSDIQTQINGLGSTSGSDALVNHSLAATVAANALTIALKDAAGANPSAGSPVKIAFRSATLTSGDITTVSVSAATSTVISSGSTAGHLNAIRNFIYVGALNNAGAVELCWSTRPFDENALISTTAEGGAGAADSATVIYSTTARSNVAVRFLGKLVSTQTTAGTWSAIPTNIQTGSGPKVLAYVPPTVQVYTTAQSGTYTTPTSPRVPLWIQFKLIGGGAGGGGSGTGTSGGTSGAGGDSTFAGSTGGGAAAVANYAASPGGTASLGSPAIFLTVLNGNYGNGGQTALATQSLVGGNGCVSQFGNGGVGTIGGPAAGVGHGSGGAGGQTSNANTGAGGGCGAYVEGIISNPAATYSFSIGAGGTAGAAGTSGAAGAAGKDGYLLVIEYYQ